MRLKLINNLKIEKVWLNFKKDVESPRVIHRGN